MYGGGADMPNAPALSAALISVISGCIGIACSYASMRAARVRRSLLDTPTSKAQGVFIGDVEVKGTAELQKPLRSFLTESACVYYTWSVAEHWSRIVVETYRDEKGNSRTRTRTEAGTTTIASGGEMTPFFVKDDTGFVLVRPDGARLEPSTTLSTSCGADHPLYYVKGPANAVVDSTHVRTFSETAIGLHQEVFVVGRARERADTVAAEIAFDPDARLFIVSVRDEASIGGGYRVAAWVWSIFGLLISVAGFTLYASGVNLTQTQTVFGYAMSVAAYFIGLALVWSWMTLNTLLVLRERVRRAWSNIDVQLRRRHDLLPNLVEVVKGIRGHEAETQRVIAFLRSQSGVSPEMARGSQARVVGVAPLIFALAESYPALKAQSNFLALQVELSQTESRIALARSYYNAIATAYNARIVVMPVNGLAAIGGLRAAPFFEATNLEREVERINFAQ